MNKIILALLFCVLAASPAFAAEKIKITIGDDEITATLLENSTAKDLMSLLPLTLSFRDYANAEKVARLPRNLDTSGAVAYDPELSDIALFAGEIVVYYKDQPYYPGIVPIAKIDGDGVKKFAEQRGNFTATISADAVSTQPELSQNQKSGCALTFSPFAIILGIPLILRS